MIEEIKNTGYLLTQATIDDADIIAQIYNDATQKTYANLDTEKSVEEIRVWLKEQESPYVIIKAVTDGAVVGFTALSPYKNSKAVVSVYVDLAYRGLGIGHVLMEYIVEHARRSSGISMLVAYIISINKPSICLHESFGFIRSGTIKKNETKYDKPVDLNMYRLWVK